MNLDKKVCQINYYLETTNKKKNNFDDFIRYF